MRFTVQQPDKSAVVTLEEKDEGVHIKVNGYYVFSFLNGKKTVEWVGNISPSETGLALTRDGRVVLSMGETTFESVHGNRST